MNWYVLYTSSRAEKQVEKNLIADGIEVFLPLHLSPRKWSDRIKMVEVPLFSSYIFVRTSDHILRSLLKISGISRIVFYNGQPAIVHDQEIQEIQKFLEKIKGKECELVKDKECELVKDDEVQIIAGPLKNMRGKVQKAKGEYLYLNIDQIGIKLKVKLNQAVKK